MAKKDGSTFSPRQTITELFVQMHGNRHPDADLLAIQKAYRVACLMFAANYRANEKPFVCHLVGTASAVAHFSNRLDLIQTAMLHAAFDLGQFPDGSFGGATDAHRKWLSSQVGIEVSRLAERYEQFKFGPSRVAELAMTYKADNDRDIVLVRLCNEIDDLSGGGLAFAAKHGEKVMGHARNCAVLANEIGKPEIGDTIVRLAEWSDAMDWTRSLRPDQPKGYRAIPNLRAYLKLQYAHRRGKRVKAL